MCYLPGTKFEGIEGRDSPRMDFLAGLYTVAALGNINNYSTPNRGAISFCHSLGNYNQPHEIVVIC